MPVCTGSTTILVAVVKGKDVTKDSINAAMKAAASASYGYNEEAIVSSDVIGMKYGLCLMPPDHGRQDRRRHLSGAGRVLV